MSWEYGRQLILCAVVNERASPRWMNLVSIMTSANWIQAETCNVACGASRPGTSIFHGYLFYWINTFRWQLGSWRRGPGDDSGVVSVIIYSSVIEIFIRVPHTLCLIGRLQDQLTIAHHNIPHSIHGESTNARYISILFSRLIITTRVYSIMEIFSKFYFLYGK